MAAEKKPANKLLAWQEVIDRIAEEAFVLSDELQAKIDEDEEPLEDDSYMTVGELITMLKDSPDNLRVRFHTQYVQDLTVLSVYSDTREGVDAAFLEIDLGKGEEGE